MTTIDPRYIEAVTGALAEHRLTSATRDYRCKCGGWEGILAGQSE